MWRRSDTLPLCHTPRFSGAIRRSVACGKLSTAVRSVPDSAAMTVTPSLLNSSSGGARPASGTRTFTFIRWWRRARWHAGDRLRAHRAAGETRRDDPEAAHQLGRVSRVCAPHARHRPGGCAGRRRGRHAAAPIASRVNGAAVPDSPTPLASRSAAPPAEWLSRIDARADWVTD